MCCCCCCSTDAKPIQREGSQTQACYENDRLLVDELSLNFSDRFIKPYLSRIKRTLERAAARNKRGKAQNEKLEKQLRMAVCI